MSQQRKEGPAPAGRPPYDGNGADSQLSIASANESSLYPRKPASYPMSHPYRIKNGELVRVSDGNGYETSLCNFVARIASQEMRDDGTAQKRHFRVEGTLSDGSPLPAAWVSAEEFANLNWVLRCWGAKAVVRPGFANKEHLRAAIQSLSECESLHTYVHTGWREVMGKKVFLHSDGAIGQCGNDPGIAVKLSQALALYRLPDPKGNDKERTAAAIRDSLEILRLGERVGYPLIAATYLAPLSDFIAPDFSLFFSGQTGTYKSCVTALAQAHFGPDFNDRSLPGSWSSTANALEKALSLVKNCVFVIDDFKPSANRNENSDLFKKGDRVFRGIGNQAGRGRLSSDSELRATPIPRAVCIASGEDIPPGHSCRARLLIIEMNKGDVDLRVLSELQQKGRAGGFALSMAAFIRWIAQRYDALAKSVPEMHRELRESLQAGGGHGRTLDAVVKLLCALGVFLEFAVEKGALAVDGREAHLGNAKEVLLRLGASQEEHQAAEDPCLMVLEGFRAMLLGGDAHLVRAGDGRAPWPPERYGWKDKGGKPFTAQGTHDVSDFSFQPQGKLIGWVGEGEVMLQPTQAYTEFERLKGALPFGPKTLWKRLKERGWLVCDSQKSMTKRTVHGIGRTTVVVIPENIFCPLH